jgi:hypothetical protein
MSEDGTREFASLEFPHIDGVTEEQAPSWDSLLAIERAFWGDVIGTRPVGPDENRYEGLIDVLTQPLHGARCRCTLLPAGPAGDPRSGAVAKAHATART